VKYYIDITLLANADIAIHFLWQRVYQQIHLGLVEIQGDDNKTPIGIAFPEYNEARHQLGSKLRLFAKDQATLQNFDAQRWLSRLSDYVHITSIREVPVKIAKYACFYRIHVKSSNARMARRKARREGISENQALLALGDRQEKLSKAPYLRINSQSSGEKFRLFIGCMEQHNGDSSNGFSSYGLSRESPVPVF
jgi:CRISPR-associated endonuclease Csy4